MINESPINFNTVINYKKHNIFYTNLMELGQGGPEVGNINLNGEKVNDHFFGGPILYDNEYIYLPIYLKKIVSFGFKLARISLKNKEIQIYGKFYNLIYLDRVEENKVYFYKDIQKSEFEVIDLTSSPPMTKEQMNP